MLTDQTVRELLDSFSASTPTPGGGSAAALSGALGASLLAMVAGLPKTRHGTPEDRTALDDARAKLLACQRDLVDLVDRDAAAYDLVVAAFKRPKATDDEKAARKQAIQDATRVASEVPVETMRACADALMAGRTVAECGNASAASDVAVGAQTLMTAFQGAWLNVAVNLGGLSDQGVRDAIGARAKALIESMSASIPHIYRAGGVTDLYKQATEYMPLHHGSPAPLTPAQLAGPAMELLRRLGSEDARRALTILAAGSDDATASAARAALEKFDERGESA